MGKFRDHLADLAFGYAGYLHWIPPVGSANTPLDSLPEVSFCHTGQQSTRSPHFPLDGSSLSSSASRLDLSKVAFAWLSTRRYASSSFRAARFYQMKLGAARTAACEPQRRTNRNIWETLLRESFEDIFQVLLIEEVA